ncbi:MAG TPA: ABC transporter permease subunit, partial [Actinomycetota bacterium]|nr:ABC transporter permease subunit [Actinomycetota bacterium]
MDASTLELLLRAIGPLLLGAIAGTIPLTLLSFLIGLVIALATALARLSTVKILTWLAGAYISVIRGTPLLVQLYIIFYALPSLGVIIDPFPSAVIAFS